MNLKFRNLMLPLLAGAVVFSCDQKELDEVNPSAEMSAEAVEKAVSANLLYNETFEGSSYFSNITKQFGTSHAFTIATSPVYQGAKSGRIELRDSDPETSGGTRSEVLFPEQTHRERWYSFAAYFPSATYAIDSNNDIINQWHQGGGLSPAMTLRVKNDRFFIKAGNTKEGRQDLDLGAMKKNVWEEFVIHVIHSAGSDGLIEVWRNGTKVLTHKGGNMYDLKLPRWKVGIYKDNWNGSGTTDSKLRAFYLDNVRMGNERATFSEMSSGAPTTAPVELTPTTTAPAPTAPVTTAPAPEQTTTGSSQVSSLVLVNAAIDKDVMTLTNGAAISYSALGTQKLNFRANLSAAVGSVKFELKGAMSHTYADNAAPHALFGDDGNGNFYHGGIVLPAGSYTLTATPYSGTKGTGTPGTPVTVSFTVKN